MIDSWFPQNYQITQDISLGKARFAGKKWQIFENTCADELVLIVEQSLAVKWIEKSFLPKDVFGEFSFSQTDYCFVCSGEDALLLPVNGEQWAISDEDGLSFATALSESRKIDPDTSFAEGIFIERYSRILPQYDENLNLSDDVVLGQWLTRGTQISATSADRVLALSPMMTKKGLDVILEKVQLKKKETALSKSKAKEKGEKQKEPFSLPGRAELENFFKEHIIDVVENPEDYHLMGIDFPSAFILQGPPGCGKTYAVERLIEYLDWPSYSIDSGSVGSPFIHETSKKVAKVFEEAMENAPSVIVIDEMEAFLTSRDSAGAGGGHHIEEVAEFLRKIPEASKKHVLVIAMTNLISKVDEAIRRKGRFDHILEVGMPSAIEVEQVILHALSKLPHDEAIDIQKLSVSLEGRPMSDVAFVIKEAARLTARAHKKSIEEVMFIEVIEKLEKTQSPKMNKIGF